MRIKIHHVLMALVLVSLLAIPTAFAQKRSSDMQKFEYNPSSAGASGKKGPIRPGQNIRSFDGAEVKEKKSDPLKPLYALGLIAFILLACSPLAIRLFRDNKKRLADEGTFGRNPGGVGEPVSRSRGSDASSRGGGDSGSTSLARVGDDTSGEQSPSVPLVSPEELHEKVWYTLADAMKWLSAEGVARLAKLDVEQVRSELATLADEGHISESTDKMGRPIYKFKS